MEEEVWTSLKGMEAKERLNPSLDDNFAKFGLKTGCYKVSCSTTTGCPSSTIGCPSSTTGCPILLQETNRKLRRW